MKSLRVLLLSGICFAVSIFATVTESVADEMPRVAYLDDATNPYYPHLNFPKLITPQWVGEAGVECVVTLAIDDMRDVARYENYLRPILERLKKIDGRAPVSIMTCNVDPKHPQLQTWLAEGLSIECHTIDHPCPLLNGGDFAKAKSTYDRCVDLMNEIPGNKPVAFRVPCCDSRNTPSPRFYTEIFNKQTAKGNFLQIDSSVCNIITSNDKSLPRELTTLPDGTERFRRYLPFPSFVNTIEDYPYPYLIGGKCWEFPCVVPSDWSAQHVQKPNNPDTVRDLKIALDAIVLKQGTFNLIFHPHGWIRADQIVELIDHAVAKHGKKVKFLTFKECAERLNKYLLRDVPLHNKENGRANFWFTDRNNDGYLDVNAIDYAAPFQAREWNAATHTWRELSWKGNEIFGKVTSAWSRNKDIDGDGKTEYLWILKSGETGVHGSRVGDDFPLASFRIPDKIAPLQSNANGADLWLLDINGDGKLDLLFSNAERYSLHLFKDMKEGWAIKVVEGVRGQPGGIGPMIPPFVRADGTNNGAWIHSRHIWWQNEDTAKLPDNVDRLSFDQLLGKTSAGQSSRHAPRGEPVSGNAAAQSTSPTVSQNPSIKTDTSAKQPPVSEQPRQAERDGFYGAPIPIGAAKVDVTPDYPIRLHGYGQRKVEATEVAQRITAKALAIGADSTGKAGSEGPAVLITLENCGMTSTIRDAVAKGLAASHNIKNERIAISVSHTHTGPMLKGWAGFITGATLPADQQERIDRYARETTAKLIAVAQEALKARRPGTLAWGEGKVGFAINRRKLTDGRWTGFGSVKDGPVDHSLPILVAKDEQGKLIAIVSNYACHCTTLGGGYNKIAGDWAGFAMSEIEADHPGCVSLVTIGCGADANPEPRRDDIDLCRQHGRAVADEVKRLLGAPQTLKRLPAGLQCKLQTIELPFDTLPTKEQWQEKVKAGGPTGFHAQKFLERLERGDAIPNTLSYPIATWLWDTDAVATKATPMPPLAIVFLGGEVVVDYAIRLKTELNASRLWITAYTNDVPCYIASQRVLREGGYEADFSMIYYGRPTRFAPEAEDVLVNAVKKMLPPAFSVGFRSAKAPALAEQEPTINPTSDADKLPPPKSPQESLAAIKVKAGFKVELVAAEPLIEDPVAFDWGPDGRTLWVVEMRDYPNGLTWNGPGQTKDVPGGRVKLLTDTDGDGRFDRSQIFLDGLRYPTGVKSWGKGILVTAAPEIFYAADTNGDGSADKRETLYEGFGEGNQQHRVNGLRWGLDNWLYLANGDSGGSIKSVKTGKTVDIRGRDLRIRPDTGDIDPQAGQTQFGRCRDDWGNWFGGNNSNPLWHYVLEDHYVRRNPHFAPPSMRRDVPTVPGAAPVFPISKTFARFNQPHSANRFTSACSPEIYRDTYLFPVVPALRDGNSKREASATNKNPSEEKPTLRGGISVAERLSYESHVFICEPVHNLVHHEIMTPSGVSFTSRRPDDEQQSEFLASTDNWFRPVMIRTAPDGALWLADMYRAVIEHPQWIPEDWQRRLDLRAGTDRGRIYRIVREDTPPREPLWLDKLNSTELVAALDSPNGWQRDMVQQRLVGVGGFSQETKEKKEVVVTLEKLATSASLPQVRGQALSALESLGEMKLVLLEKTLQDSHAEVRRQAVRLVENFARTKTSPTLSRERWTALAHDPSPIVRLQTAHALGEVADGKLTGELLGQLALDNTDDSQITAAICSSLSPDNLDAAFDHVTSSQSAARSSLTARLLSMAAAFGRHDVVAKAIHAIAIPPGQRASESQFTALGGLLNSLEQQKGGADAALDAGARAVVRQIAADARQIAASEKEPEVTRAAAIALLGRDAEKRADDRQQLAGFLSPRMPVALQTAAVTAISRFASDEVPATLLAGWSNHGPTLRAQVLELLASRDAWTVSLLDAIRDKKLPANQIDARRRQQLLSHKNQKVRNTAEEVFAAASEPSRLKVLEQFRSAITLAGDVGRGKTVFAKRCANCHQLDGAGHKVGPDLGAVGNKSPEALILSILDPNRAIEDRYLDYVVITDDGRSLTGMIGAETSTSLTLLGPEGKSTIVLRNQIDEFRSTGKSLMPEGLERDLSPQDLADVMAYLRGVAPIFPAKSFPGNKPELVKPAPDGTLALLASSAKITGPKIVFEQKYKNLGYWTSPDDVATWTIEVPTAGDYRISLDYACQDSVAGNKFALTIAGQTLTGPVEGTGTWDTYRTKEIGLVKLPAGQFELQLKSNGPIRSPLMDLRTVLIKQPK